MHTVCTLTLLLLFPLGLFASDVPQTSTEPARLFTSVHSPSDVFEPTPDDGSKLVLRRAELNIDRSALTPLHWLESNRMFSRLHAPGLLTVGGKRVVAELFPDATFTLDLHSVQEVAGATVHTGRVTGQPNSYVNLAMDGSSVEGIIATHKARFRITGGAKGPVVVEQISLGHLSAGNYIGDDQPTQTSKPIGLQGRPPVGIPPSLRSTNSVVRVLILYTTAVRVERTMSTYIAGLISAMNDSLSGSNVYDTVELAHSYEVNYSDEAPASAWSDMIGGSVDPDLEDERAAWGADVVVLIVDDDANGDTTRGVATAYKVTSDDGTLPYAVVEDDYALLDYTFGHEVGHMLAGAHTTWDTETIVEVSSGRGWWRDDLVGEVHIPDDWFTMMAAYERCDEFDPPQSGACSGAARQNFWSNQDQQYQGHNRGDYTFGHMTPVLEEYMDYVAAYVATPGSPPSTPGTLTVSNAQCYGANDTSWGASSGDVGDYELYASTNMSYTGQVLAYRGNALGLVYEVPPSTSHYLRVRACNAAGCSGYSASGLPATYFAGCP